MPLERIPTHPRKCKYKSWQSLFSLSGSWVCSLLSPWSLSVDNFLSYSWKDNFSFSLSSPFVNLKAVRHRRVFPSQRSVFFLLSVWSRSHHAIPLSVSISDPPSLRHLFNLGTAAASLHLGNGAAVGAQDVDEHGALLTKKALVQHTAGASVANRRGFFFSSADLTITPTIDDGDQFAAVGLSTKWDGDGFLSNFLSCPCSQYWRAIN